MISQYDNYFKWDVDNDTQLRKLRFTYQTEFIREVHKFEKWNGEFRVCSKCSAKLPLTMYFFNSGGENKYHKQCKKCEGTPNYGWGVKKQKEFNANKYHYCRKCDRVLPLNEFYFTISNGRCNKTGFSSNCKECTSINGGFGLHSINLYKELLGISYNYKICHKCLVEFPDNDEYFFKKNDREVGTTCCKKCLGFSYGVDRINIVYSEEIPEGFKMCVDCRILVEESLFNKQSSRCSACFQKRNRHYNSLPKIKQYRKNYYQQPDAKKKIRMRWQKRRATKAKVDNSLTLEQYESTLQYFNYSCAYCGTTKDESVKIYDELLHQDHIVPLSKNGAYTNNNIIPACRKCNCSKNDKDLVSYYEYANDFTQDNYIKIIKFIIKTSSLSNEDDIKEYLVNNNLLKFNSKEYDIIFP